MERFTKGHFDNINIENRLIDKTGRETYVAWTISVAYDYSGAPVYYRAIGRDVTTERLAEQKLREQEEYFRTVIQTSPDTIALIRTDDGRILDVNEIGLKMFGYNFDDTTSEELRISNDLWEDVVLREHFRTELLAVGLVDNFEATFVKKDGQTFTGLVSARSIVYRGEQCHLAYIKNITEIKETTLALQSSEAKYRKLYQEFVAVLDGIVDSLVLLNPDLKVVWGNRGAALHFGFEQDDLFGKSCREL